MHHTMNTPDTKCLIRPQDDDEFYNRLSSKHTSRTASIEIADIKADVKCFSESIDKMSNYQCHGYKVREEELALYKNQHFQIGEAPTQLRGESLNHKHFHGNQNMQNLDQRCMDIYENVKHRKASSVDAFINRFDPFCESYSVPKRELLTERWDDLSKLKSDIATDVLKNVMRIFPGFYKGTIDEYVHAFLGGFSTESTADKHTQTSPATPSISKTEGGSGNTSAVLEKKNELKVDNPMQETKTSIDPELIEILREPEKRLQTQISRKTHDLHDSRITLEASDPETAMIRKHSEGMDKPEEHNLVTSHKDCNQSALLDMVDIGYCNNRPLSSSQSDRDLMVPPAILETVRRASERVSCVHSKERTFEIDDKGVNSKSEHGIGLTSYTTSVLNDRMNGKNKKVHESKHKEETIIQRLVEDLQSDTTQSWRNSQHWKHLLQKYSMVLQLAEEINANLGEQRQSKSVKPSESCCNTIGTIRESLSAMKSRVRGEKRKMIPIISSEKIRAFYEKLIFGNGVDELISSKIRGTYHGFVKDIAMEDADLLEYTSETSTDSFSSASLVICESEDLDSTSECLVDAIVGPPSVSLSIRQITKRLRGNGAV